MVKITGDKAVTSRLQRMGGREKVELVGKALFVGGEMIKAEASRLITEGAVSGAGHVASAPGEPPNEDTGQLRIGQEVLQLAPLRVEYSSSAPHAVPLERGTSKMAERPSVGPAVRRKREEIVALVEKAVGIAIRRK
jgi:hypothetical protein